MSTPVVGQQRRVTCSWCGKHEVTETWRPYPPGSGVTAGFFWEQGEGACGRERDYLALSLTPAILKMGRVPSPEGRAAHERSRAAFLAKKTAGPTPPSVRPENPSPRSIR